MWKSKLENRTINKNDFKKCPDHFWGWISDARYIKIHNCFYVVVQFYSTDNMWVSMLIATEKERVFETIPTWCSPWECKVIETTDNSSIEFSFLNPNSDDVHNGYEKFYNTLYWRHSKIRYIEDGQIFNSYSRASTYASMLAFDDPSLKKLSAQSIGKHCRGEVNEETKRFEFVYTKGRNSFELLE